MARTGRSKPAMRTSVSRRASVSRGAVGVDRGDRAVVAGVHGLEHVEGLAGTALADDDAVGPHAEGVLDEVADGDLALALDVRRAGPPCASTWSWWSWSSLASSTVTMRSSAGMNDDSTLSVVVLPVPVPPETMMLSRPTTQAWRNRAECGVERAEPDQVVDLVAGPWRTSGW